MKERPPSKKIWDEKHKDRDPPIAIRFTKEEKERILKAVPAGMSIGQYIKQVILDICR